MIQFTLCVDTITELKTLTTPGMAGQTILALGSTTYGDGLGGFYRWAPGDTTAEDKTNWNVVSPADPSTGRWLRVFARVRMIGTSTLVVNGSFKSLFVPGTTDANGRVTCQLTDDGTSSGNPLFTSLLMTAGESTVVSTDPNAALVGSRYSLTANLKTLVYQFSTGNSSVLGVLGVTVVGLRTAGAGKSVMVRIDGV